MTKKLFILGILLLVSVSASEILSPVEVFAQVGTAWARRYNGPDNGEDRAHAIVVDGSGNVYVTGASRGSGSPGYDDCAATIKYYPNGNTAWVKRYSGSAGGAVAFDIAIDGSGNVYVTGWSMTPFVGALYMTIKYYPNGDTAWLRTYNVTTIGSLDYPTAIAVDASGNVYVTGVSIGMGTYYDYATIKYYPDGDSAWVRRYNGPENSDDMAFAIAVDGSGNVYVTGQSWGDGTGFDYATIKYYSNGDIAWIRRYDGPANSEDKANAIAVDGSGNVYVTGFSVGLGTDYDYATIKYSPNGDVAWVRRYNGPTNSWDQANAIAVDGSNNAFVTGFSVGLGIDYDYATIKYSPNGDTAWVRRYDGTGNSDDVAFAMVVDGSANVYVTGRSIGSGTSYDYATIKYDQNGNKLWVRRYNGTGNYYDDAYAMAVDGSGNVYVTGWSFGSGTDYDYATIKYVQTDTTCYSLGNISICANSITDLGDGNFRAEDSVWIGNEAGYPLYLYLGDEAQITFNIDQGTVGSVFYTNVKLSVKEKDYTIDDISSLGIDPQAGRVSFSGRVHFAADAIFQSSFSGACTLEVNLHEIYGRIQFDNGYFGTGTVGIHRGVWDLEGCPFMGMSDDINLTVPVGLTNLTVLDGQITLGVFLNSGIFRVGMTNGALEFKESGGAFGLDLTGLLAPPGVPSQGTIDVDLAHLRVNVVKDIPIGLWEYPKGDRAKKDSFNLKSRIVRTDWHSLRRIDQNKYEVDVYDEEGNKYQKFLLDVGLTIKGEEPYTDLDCDGYHDPDEPFVDEDEDGEWDEGANIALLNEFQQPIFDAHGHATLDLSLFAYIHFTCGELVVDIHYPTHKRIDLQTWTGLKLGNIFDVDLTTGYLHLDFENQEYYGSATLGNPQFTGLSFAANLLIAFQPFQFTGEINENFNIEGVDFLTADGLLHLDQHGFYSSSYLDAFQIIYAEGKFFITTKAIDGSFLGDFHIDGWHLAQFNNRFHFGPDQCMSGSGSVRLCIWKLCRGVPFSYRICSEINWWVNIGGLSISLGSPAKLHIYDSQGRHTGINAQGGIDTQIPGSEFYIFGDVGQQLAFLPDPDLVGGYTIDVEGLADSVFDLDILYPNRANGNAYNVGYFEEPTHTGALHRVSLNVNNNWTMQNDLDGDSIFESQTLPDSTANATLDTTMVTITNVASEIICANDAKITWKTNVPATSEVLYRSQGDSVYKSVSDTTLTTSHSVIVNNILTTDTYYYIPVSVDTSGNIASFLEKSFRLEYVVGDVNRNGVINVTDVVYLINYLFLIPPGPAPIPLEAGDVNCDGFVNVTDVVYLINYLFLVPPGPPPCD